MVIGEAETPRGDERVLRDLVEGYADQPVIQGHTALPALSEAQIRQAVSIIPANYCKLSYWTCRLDGHSMFSCPYQYVEQRI